MHPILTIFLLTLSLSACTQNLDCSALKKGKFQIPTESMGNVIIERTDSLHIETLPELGKKTIEHLEWTGDCSFVIEYLSGDIPPGLNARKPIACEIIEIGEGYHIVRSRIVGTDIEADYRMEEVD